jgi:PhnB protein
MTIEVNPYLFFDGQCEAAFKFYEHALGGKIVAFLHVGDAPPDVPKTPEMANKIMHASLRVGDRFVMGSDWMSEEPFPGTQGFRVNINVDEPVAAERIFTALSEGGKITMPMSKTFWAKRFGMVTDRFGVPWMVNCADPAS